MGLSAPKPIVSLKSLVSIWERWPSLFTAIFEPRHAQACPAGSFCLEGEVLPVPCPEGTQLSSEGGSSSEDCEMCAPGRFADVAGTAECEPCKIGRYVAEPGRRKCLESPMGSYQNATGQSSYIVCPASFITHFSGADNAGACVCARNTFLNRRAKAFGSEEPEPELVFATSAR